METVDPDEALKVAQISRAKQDFDSFMELAKQTFSDDDAVAKKARQKYKRMIRQFIDKDESYAYWFLYYCLEKQRRILAEADIDKLEEHLRRLKKT